MSLTKEQIARVFVNYWGQQAFYTNSFGDKKEAFKISAVFDNYWYHDCKPYPKPFPIDGSKLILRPLSAITDEDAVEVAKINGWCYHEGKGQGYIMSVAAGRRIISAVAHDGAINKGYSIYQYLIQQGYAVPLFHGPNHPENGKTAIESGLAIDITTLK